MAVILYPAGSRVLLTNEGRVTTRDMAHSLDETGYVNPNLWSVKNAS